MKSFDDRDLLVLGNGLCDSRFNSIDPAGALINMRVGTAL